MRILVTRPEHAGHETAKRLIELGHQPVLLPLSRPVHETAEAQRALHQPHAAIAISSAEAARAIAPLGTPLDAALPRPLFAVGSASAAAARALGFTDIRVASGQGESLADLVAHDLRGPLAEKPLLYLAGSPRSPRFEARLAAHNIQVTVCVCYRMEPIAYTAEALHLGIQENRPEAALFYSAEAVRHFFSLDALGAFEDPLQDMRFLCLSANVLAAIPSSFRDKAVASATPDEAALLALI